MKQGPSREPDSFSASLRNSFHFIERKGSLPHSQEPFTSPCLVAYQSIPQVYPIYWRSVWILSSCVRLDLPSGHFLSGFYNKSLCVPHLSHIRPTCPTNPRNVYRQQILRKCIIVQMSNEDAKRKPKLHYLQRWMLEIICYRPGKNICCSCLLTYLTELTQ
jgi:hypothetical protein